MGGIPSGGMCCPGDRRNPEEEQIQFIERWKAGRVTFAELCGQFGISRKTGYKRVQRYEAYGWEGLGDRSRVRHRHPNRTSRAVAERLIAFKHARPKWGPNASKVGPEEDCGETATSGAR